MLKALSLLHAKLGHSKVGRRLIRVLPLRWFGRRWLARHVLSAEAAREPSVTVLIGVRDRCDQRLRNALASLREQTYPRELLRICVVDYGSDSDQAECVNSLCHAFGAECLTVTGVAEWSRSHCLNIGIRQCQTRYVLVSDVDVMFSPRYVEEAVAMLSRDPLTAVASTMWDLPPESLAELDRAAAGGPSFPMSRWLPKCAARNDWPLHPSVLLISASLLALIGGYDEFFRVWGYEDRDLERRLQRLGIEILPIDGDSFYLHQWHPKYEGVDDEALQAHIARNQAYFRATTGILRNADRWGWIA